MEQKLSSKSINAAMQERERIENEIFGAAFDSNMIDSQVIEKYSEHQDKGFMSNVRKYGSRYYYIQAYRINSDEVFAGALIEIYSSINLNKKTDKEYTEVNYLINEGVTHIRHKSEEKENALFKPAEMKFNDGKPTEVRYFINGVELTEEEHERLMNGQLGRLISGETPEYEKAQAARDTQKLVQGAKRKKLETELKRSGII